MAYVPNASDPTQPTEDKFVESAALEFRTLKTLLVRGVLFPETDPPTAIADLPTAAARAGKVLGFDVVTGVPVAVATLPSDVLVSAFMEPVLVAADAEAAQIALGLEIGVDVANTDLGTESDPGLLELASLAEVAAGVDTTKAVHSAGVKSRLPIQGVPVLQGGARVINTDYTNATAAPRIVRVYGNNGATTVVIQYSPDSGTTWIAFAASALPSGVALAVGTFTVPPGGTYRVRSQAGTLTVTEWWEQA